MKRHYDTNTVRLSSRAVLWSILLAKSARKRSAQRAFCFFASEKSSCFLPFQSISQGHKAARRPRPAAGASPAWLGAAIGFGGQGILAGQHCYDTKKSLGLALGCFLHPGQRYDQLGLGVFKNQESAVLFDAAERLEGVYRHIKLYRSMAGAVRSIFVCVEHVLLVKETRKIFFSLSVGLCFDSDVLAWCGKYDRNGLGKERFFYPHALNNSIPSSPEAVHALP